MTLTTYGDLLRQGTALLREAGIEDAVGDARALMANCLKIDRARLTLILTDKADYFTLHEFMVDIRDRAAHRPVSSILGYRAFYGRRFEVTDDVLDPRPETETLVAAALEHPFAEVLDLGTGTGCILLTLLAERDKATGVGTDLSQRALEVAARNARALGVEGRLWLTHSDWFAGIDGRFDLIVSNPPYIAADEMVGLAPEVRDHDPHMALTDGADGLTAYRQIAHRVGGHLTPKGRCLLEVGAGQAEDVAAIVRAAGLDVTTFHPDLDGRPRVVEVCLNPQQN